MQLGRIVQDLVEREVREVEGHELDDRPEADHRGTDPELDRAKGFLHGVDFATAKGLKNDGGADGRTADAD